MSPLPLPARGVAPLRSRLLSLYLSISLTALPHLTTQPNKHKHTAPSGASFPPNFGEVAAGFVTAAPPSISLSPISYLPISLPKFLKHTHTTRTPNGVPGRRHHATAVTTSSLLSSLPSSLHFSLLSSLSNPTCIYSQNGAATDRRQPHRDSNSKRRRAAATATSSPASPSSLFSLSTHAKTPTPKPTAPVLYKLLSTLPPNGRQQQDHDSSDGKQGSRRRHLSSPRSQSRHQPLKAAAAVLNSLSTSPLFRATHTATAAPSVPLSTHLPPLSKQPSNNNQ